MRALQAGPEVSVEGEMMEERGGGGVEAEEGTAREGIVENAASRRAAAPLAASAAEKRRVVEAERGVGDRAKVALMQKRSEVWARRSGGGVWAA